jgi:hypothetical protein
LVAIGGAMNVAGVREFPAWVSEDALIIVAGLYVAAHAIGMTVAIIGKPVPSPRLPNLAQTASRMAFPEPPTHRARRTAYSARQRKAVRP